MKKNMEITAANGKTITPELIKKWLKDDMEKIHWTVSIVLRNEDVLDLITQKAYEDHILILNKKEMENAINEEPK